MTECMHDVANHIDNIIAELPNHVDEDDKLKIDEILEIYNNEKEQKRCCDKRKILLQLTLALDEEITGKIIKLLKTFCEIQRILYLEDESRTQREVLRLHNSCFQHYVLMKDIFSTTFVNLTREKMYGKYNHNLLIHAPMQYRLVSGSSINAEGEERFFNSIKRITKNTSDNKPGHIIGNLIIRTQVESRSKERYVFDERKDNVLKEISNHGKDVRETEVDSFFTKEYIKNHPQDWQSHLERISDYLILGRNVWWRQDQFGVEFFDSPNNKEANKIQLPRLYHFRSANNQDIVTMLKQKWSMISDENIDIPLDKILVGEEMEAPHWKETNFLEDEEIEEDLTPCILELYDATNQNEFNDTVVAVETNNELLLQYHTKEGRSLHKLLGELAIIKEFDSQKYMLKKHGKKNLSKNVMKQMRNVHQQVKDMVLENLSNLNSIVMKWEHEFMSKIENENSSPTQEDYKSDELIADAVKKINISNQLINLWKKES